MKRDEGVSGRMFVVNISQFSSVTLLGKMLGQVKAEYVRDDPVAGENQNAGGQNPRCGCHHPQSSRRAHRVES